MLIGGVLATLPMDMDQAQKMLNMRIKIDVWSKGLSNSQRHDIRGKLGKLFCQLPERRIWLYLKRVRFMLHPENKREAAQAIDVSKLEWLGRGEEAEDVIVDGKSLKLGNSLYADG